MPRFQLVFRTPNGERTEMRDNAVIGKPMIGDEPLVGGKTYKIHGVRWLVTRDNSATGVPRYVCTPVDPDDAGVVPDLSG